MADVDFIFETADGQLFALLADAVERERHELAAVATEHEVEEGVAITDHVREQAPTFGCVAVFSDTPLRTIVGEEGQQWFGVNVFSQQRDLERYSGRTVTRAASARPPARGNELGEGSTVAARATVLSADAEITRRVDSWAVVQSAMRYGWRATIRTQLHTFRSMVLLQALTVLEAADGTWLKAELSFRQIRQVATELVDAREPLRPRDREQTDQGAQATEDVDASEVRRSLLSQGVGFLTGGG